MKLLVLPSCLLCLMVSYLSITLQVAQEIESEAKFQNDFISQLVKSAAYSSFFLSYVFLLVEAYVSLNSPGSYWVLMQTISKCEICMIG